MPGIRFVCSLVLAVSLPVASTAQPPQPPRPATSQDAAELARGWQLLAEGRAADAAKVAADVLAASPRHAAAFSLAIEAALATGGTPAALTLYERWLGERRLEEPGALRAIAVARLRATAVDVQDSATRIAALQALARDGDRSARQQLETLRAAGGIVAERAMAASGDATAVKRLASALETSGAAEGVLALEALGASGSREAAPAIAARLTDERSEIRGAAAEALGRMGATDYGGALRELLNDRSFYVRLKAAGALARLGDDSGAAAARELAAHESPTVRLAAAEAMAAQPTDEWKNLVRSLLADSNPEVRMGAARLLAPYDPDAAFAALDALGAHENPVVRQLAVRATGEIETSDLTVLRRLLKADAPLVRVRAAARVLALTR
jgi:HEAT repeat protein